MAHCRGKCRIVTDEAVLLVAGLAVRRGGRILLRDLNFSVAPGQALHLAGGNGAGKTSLLRVLAGLLPAAAGRVERADSFLFLPVADGLKPALTVTETVQFMADWLDAPRQRISAVLERLGLAGISARPVRFLSTGQRRRLALASMALTDRQLWLLDEPTLGLDSDGLACLTRLIADCRHNGAAIVFASHQSLTLPDVRSFALSGDVQ